MRSILSAPSPGMDLSWAIVCGRARTMWRSVVELIAAHETAYLEHCRRYATA